MSLEKNKLVLKTLRVFLLRVIILKFGKIGQTLPGFLM